MARFERWLEVKRIFEEALEVEPAERPGFLDRACKDDLELRREVEALLGAPAVPTAALASLLGLPRRQEEPDYAEGDRVDHFTIVREVGKGGMGIVYEARDTKNSSRAVALKVLFSRAVKLSQDQRLAGFSDPSIVTFHDSGETPDGLPYFVFEYIEGEPITAFCERRRLAIPERLRLFQKVCDAVRYAHQRLVIHCDLKPENILVTATGALKLLDFGIAKDIGTDSVSSYPSPMTLPFASPEQVGNEETTTLSDVYSLGVLLCVLLTGRLPYRNGKTVAELRDAILHEEAVPPSDLVWRGGESSSSDREMPPYSSPSPELPARQLARRLRGDLDAVILRALRKEPDQRYATVQEFAADIGRYLRKEPVAARRGSWRYRCERFISRHRVSVTLSAAVLLLILGFLLALAREKKEAVRQRDQAERQATRAEEVSHFLTDLFRVADPERKPGGVVSARELLDQAASGLENRLQGQPETSFHLLNTLGEIYRNLGVYDTSVRCHTEALILARTRLGADDLLVADALSNLGTTYERQGKFPEALKTHRLALELRRRHLPESHLDMIASLSGVGTTLAEQNRYREAEPLLREVARRLRVLSPPNPERLADALSVLGDMLADDRQLGEAEAVMRECLSLREKIYGPKHPLVALTLTSVATILEIHAKFPEAESLQREALSIDRSALGENHPTVLGIMNGLGFIQMVGRNFPQAIATFRETLAKAHANTENEDSIGVIVRLNLARALLSARQVPEAIPVLQEAYDVAVRRLGKNDWTVANIMKSQCEALLMQGNLRAAEAKVREAIPIFLEKQGERGYTYLGAEAELGTVLVQEKRFAEAEPLLLTFYKLATEREKPDAADRLVILYEAWGKLDKANVYRKFGTP
jgi:serine/threonine protein kinase